MKKLKRILYPLCAVIVLFALWNLWKIRQSTEKETLLYQELASQAHAVETVEQQTEEQDQSNEMPDDVMAGSHPVKNQWLLELKKQNEELAGWLTIPDPVIDYPVMQTAEDNDFYLDHDFERKEDPHGTPFLDVNCRIGESENLIIYGHHMKDGTIFQNLMLYKDAEFCENSGYVQFDTVEESAQYQVIFVMLISAEEAEDFPYYKCTDLSDDEIYQGFLKQCSRYAIWQAEKLPESGTKLLTLSTCEYSKDDGRLVVVAGQAGRVLPVS